MSLYPDSTFKKYQYKLYYLWSEQRFSSEDFISLFPPPWKKNQNAHFFIWFLPISNARISIQIFWFGIWMIFYMLHTWHCSSLFNFTSAWYYSTWYDIVWLEMIWYKSVILFYHYKSYHYVIWYDMWFVLWMMLVFIFY